MRRQFQFIQENSSASQWTSSVTSAMFFPPTVTARASFFRRWPPQVLTGRDPHKLLIFLLHGLGSLSPGSVRSTFRISPSKCHIVDAHAPLAFVVNLYHVGRRFHGSAYGGLPPEDPDRAFSDQSSYSLASASRIAPEKLCLSVQDCQPMTVMAPSAILRLLSGIIRSSSNSILYPNP